MKKKTAAVIMSVIICVSMLSGCGADKKADEGVKSAVPEADGISAEITAETEGEDTGLPAEEQSEEVAEKQEEGAVDDTEEDLPEEGDDAASEGTTVRIGSLKGPTSIGLLYLMDRAEKGEAVNDYEFTMTAAADELLPSMLSGDLDIVLIPANMASVLYNMAEGDVAVIDINTLGVLYMVSGNDKIKDMEDLKGQTVYMTGKGTTPDYVMQYLFKENGLTAADMTLEYKSEAIEVAAMLAETPDAVGVLPQPFVTAVCAQNEKLSVVMDLTEQWAAVQGENGSSLVTGVTVVRKGFLTDYPDAVEQFMEEHADSAAYANEHVEETAGLVAAAGIIEKAEVAAKAIPECNITYIDGEEMKTALSGYLTVLWDQNPESVGGGLPGEDFYYIN